MSREPRVSGAPRASTASRASWGPVDLQVLIGGLRSACEEMGAILIRAAHSANIKERHDCSTALFDRAGELVMQAEHIPVHLGSMPDAVAAVLDREQQPGTVWILNDPYRGGTHLPDITLITPVFAAGDAAAGGELVGFAASRAHHADVGGEVPGSMPAHSTDLAQEGVVIPPTRLTDELIERLVARMRNPAERRADLRAQAAANETGARRLIELADRHGPDRLREGMAEILAYSERRARAALAAIPDGTHEAIEWMEFDPATSAAGAGAGGDLVLRLRARLRGEELELDFTGTDGQVAGNLNCPAAVTRSAALFAVRALTDPDAPPSAGAHRPVRIEIPPGCVLAARSPAAVAAGNVETSSRVADLVIEALSGLVPAPAQGQGTMNNLTLASARSAAESEGSPGSGASAGTWTHYETLGGGQGADAECDGPDAIHVAMSNTLNTPIEALESELPLRVRELSLRRGSGGAGAHRGGDGIVRVIEALEPVRYSLITERRRLAPRGRAGGADGQPGLNRIEPAAPSTTDSRPAAPRPAVTGTDLPARAEGVLAPGEALRIETPGGGGYGSA